MKEVARVWAYLPTYYVVAVVVKQKERKGKIDGLGTYTMG